MDLLTALKILVRQWPVVLIGLVLTVVGVVQVGGLVKPTYEAKATVLLLGPGTGNRFLAFDANLEVTADALIVVMQSDSGIERVTAAGAEGGYELVRTNGPLIEITGSAPSGEEATATVERVMAVLEEQLGVAQEGAPDAERITLDVLTQPVAAPEYGSRVRAQAAVGVIGLVLTVTAGLLTDAVRRSRRERRAEAADDEARPTGGDEPDDQAGAPDEPPQRGTRGDPRVEPALTPCSERRPLVRGRPRRRRARLGRAGPPVRLRPHRRQSRHAEPGARRCSLVGGVVGTPGGRCRGPTAGARASVRQRGRSPRPSRQRAAERPGARRASRPAMTAAATTFERMADVTSPRGLYRTATHPRRFTPRGLDASWFVGLYIVALIAVPSRLVITPLGAAGGPANMLALAALAWWACSRTVPGGMAWGFNPVRWAVIAFLLTMLGGWLAAAMRPLRALEASGADRTLMVVAGFAGVALLACDGIPDVQRLERLVRWLVNLVAVMATAGILQFYTGIDVARYVRLPGFTLEIPVGQEFMLDERAGLRRVLATASHAIEFGVVLAVALPVALHLALTAAEEVRTRRWLAFGVIAFGVPLSLARSGVLGATCAMVMLWCGWAWPRKKAALKATVVYLALTRLLVDGLLGTIKGMFIVMFTGDPSVEGRKMDYDEVARMFGERPFFGRGLGTFEPSIYFILDNQYLLTLVESGLLGMVAMIVLFLVGLFTARSAYRMAHAAGMVELGELGRALAAAMLAVTVSFATFDAMSFHKVAGLLFVLLGIIGATWRLALVETSRGGTRSDGQGRAEATR